MEGDPSPVTLNAAIGVVAVGVGTPLLEATLAARLCAAAATAVEEEGGGITIPAR